VTHRAKFVLVDRHGVMRGFYSGIDSEEIGKLKVYTMRLLQDKSRPGG